MNEDRKAHARDMRRQGSTQKTIAHELHVSEATVRAWTWDVAAPPRRRYSIVDTYRDAA